MITDSSKGGNSHAPTWAWVLSRRRLGPDDLLFEEGEIYCRLSAKYLPVDDIEQIGDTEGSTSFSCGIANCSLSFDSLLRYEAHYNSTHRNVCITCKKMFPSNSLLEIHILETHDVMFSLLAEKQAMYQCLVEGCPEKFKFPKERRNHMIKVHHYPANYRFDSSKITKNSKKKAGVTGSESVSMEMEQSKPDAIQQNSGGRKFSYKVPENFCFGQGTSKGFFMGGKRGKPRKKKHWHNNTSNSDMDTTVQIENVDMNELKNVLP